jgi:predicted metal-dependent hydrolase
MPNGDRDWVLGEGLRVGYDRRDSKWLAQRLDAEGVQSSIAATGGTPTAAVEALACVIEDSILEAKDTVAKGEAYLVWLRIMLAP